MLDQIHVVAAVGERTNIAMVGAPGAIFPLLDSVTASTCPHVSAYRTMRASPRPPFAAVQTTFRAHRKVDNQHACSPPADLAVWRSGGSGIPASAR
jgi:hypothetical protein